MGGGEDVVFGRTHVVAVLTLAVAEIVVVCGGVGVVDGGRSGPGSGGCHRGH